MASSPQGLFVSGPNVNRVRLRTLVILRWIAIAGQLAAITVAQRLFDVTLEVGWCFIVIGATILVNLFSVFLSSESKRLSETEASLHLAYDITQLIALLFLTGGLHNPFAILVVVPVTVSATALRARTTAALAGFAIALVSVIAIWHVPLRTDAGEVMRMPQVFLTGTWVAIVLGIVFLSVFAQRVASEVQAMSNALAATQMALSREQKLTDLGGVVAAAAHELGTPLATIKLVASELTEELEDNPELLEDVKLIGQQADRCRDILRSMGRAGKGDELVKRVPIGAVVREAAEPHEARGIVVEYSIEPEGTGSARQPVVYRSPEMIHGLRNLIQNAVDFANETVWIDVHWSDTSLLFRVIDDGPGFPLQILGRIGDPFLRRRRGDTTSKQRPAYEGMGLGLFIAKTLLERTGAELAFANGRVTRDGKGTREARTGAIIEVSWPLSAITDESPEEPRGLGENRPIEV